MIDIPFAQLHAWLVAFLWPFVRLSAFIMAAPLLGHTTMPRWVRIGLATSFHTLPIGYTGLDRGGLLQACQSFDSGNF